MKESSGFHPKSTHPIGVFDSGIGGLTVAREISKQLPYEKLVYFGDTAHMPYGEKSSNAIRNYALKISKFLIEQPCKLIVIACNSASASAFREVQNMLPEKSCVINVIDPVVEKLSGSGKKKIGLIGTKRTVSSAVYKKKFEKSDHSVTLKSLATPLLAPMIEEGFFNNNISRTIVHSYLSHPHIRDIESLILACTHYPLIIKEIRDFYQGEVEIINSAEIVTKAVKNYLEQKNLLNQGNKLPIHKFYVSDFTDSFEESAKIFFGESVKLKEKNLWKD